MPSPNTIESPGIIVTTSCSSRCARAIRRRSNHPSADRSHAANSTRFACPAKPPALSVPTSSERKAAWSHRRAFISRSNAPRATASARPRSATPANTAWATVTTSAPTSRATATSISVKPWRSRGIGSLGPVDHCHHILDLGRGGLPQCHAIQRPFRSLDVDQELAERMTTQTQIELRAREQGEGNEEAIFGRERVLAWARVSLLAQARTHQAGQREARRRKDHQGDQDLEERDPALTATHAGSLR